MITIVKFQAFGKLCEKVFYDSESWAQIHETLYGICYTYEPTEVVHAELMKAEPHLIDYLKTHQQK